MHALVNVYNTGANRYCLAAGKRGLAHAYSYTHVPAASCVAEAAAGLVAACHQQTGQPHAAPAWESALRTVAVAAAGIARGRDPLDSAVTSMARVVCQVLDHTRPLAT